MNALKSVARTQRVKSLVGKMHLLHVLNRVDNKCFPETVFV